MSASAATTGSGTRPAEPRPAGSRRKLLELVPDQRIAWRWGFAGPQRRNGPVYDSQLTVTLAATPEGGTALTLVHTRLDDLAAAMPDVAAQVGPGWEDVLAKLAAVAREAIRQPR